MQLNYHMLEHLVRGLLHKDSSSKKNHKAFKLYGALKKLGVQSMIFNDALET